KNIPAFEVLNRRPKIQIWAKQKNVQQIAELKRSGEPSISGPDATRELPILSGRRELLGGDCSRSVGGAGAKNVDRELLQLCSVYFGELYLQEHLLLVHRRNRQRIHYSARISRRHLADVVGNLRVRHGPRKY